MRNFIIILINQPCYSYFMGIQDKKQFKGNILILCAHSDDQVLGAGGAASKYAREGYKVYTFIFSYGESSHPHVERKHVATTRVSESREADKILGGSGVFFLGLKDAKIGADFDERKMKPKLIRILQDYKPKKIFTHSEDDLLPDHRAVREVVLGAYDYLNRKENFSCDVYSFDVWNIWNLKKRNKPALVVDITQNFKYKIKALHEFRSQINFFSHTYFVNLLYIGVYIRAVVNGIRFRCKLAEVFYKIR